MTRVVEKKKNNKKKIFIIIFVVLLIVAVSIFCYKKFFSENNSNSEENIAVQSVKALTESMNSLDNKFSGMVISQKTLKVQKQSGRSIKKVYVEVGQDVKTGDKLFEYDTDDIKIKVEEANLEVEKLQNGITDSRKQIDNINAEIAANPGMDPSSLRVEIQTLENGIKQSEYNIKAKNNEIARLKKSLQNVVVKSEIDGIVQSVGEADEEENSGSTTNYSNSSENDSFITIMQTGQYKIKGVVNEQNVFSINGGDKVIIRSRVDDTKTWTGTIENIDTSNTEKSDNNRYGYSSDDDNMNKSSKYPFYVTLDSMEGLILGQHVYIEKDVGQSEVKEGLWLSNYFIVEENGEYYVWACNSKEKLEKRKVEIGNKDEETGKYQITKGLTEEDYIASPSEDLIEGLNVNKFDTLEFNEDMMDSNYDDATEYDYNESSEENNTEIDTNSEEVNKEDDKQDNKVDSNKQDNKEADKDSNKENKIKSE